MKKSDRVLLSVLGALGAFGVYLIWAPVFKVSFGRGVVLNNPDGQIIHISKDVRLRSSQQLGWETAFLDQGVLFGDQVFVGEDSAAQVQLSKMRIDIHENSLLNLQKLENSSALELDRGSLNLSLQGDDKVELKLDGKSLQIKGNDSEFTLSKNESGSTKSMGLSFIRGKSEVIVTDPKTGKPRTIRGSEGGNLVLDAKEDKIRFKKYSLELGKPADQGIFITDQKIQFTWDKLDDDVSEAVLQIATDTEFKKAVLQKVLPGNTQSYTWNVPSEAQTFFWRLQVKTKSQVQLTSNTRAFQTVQLRSLKIFSPLYSFKNPLQWDAKIILEEAAGASGYSLELARDSNFKNIVKSLNSSRPQMEFILNSGSILYARARAQYSKLEAAAVSLVPWSESIQLSIPAPPPAPVVRWRPTLENNEIVLEWNSVPEASFYRSYVSELSGDKMKFFRDIKETQVSLRCDPEQSAKFQLESHLAEGVFSRKSEMLVVPACPAPLRLVEGAIYPAYLSRFNKFPKPHLELKWQGEQLNQAVVVSISTTPDFRNARILKVTDQVNFDIENTETLFVRVKQDLPSSRYLTQWSAPLKIEKKTDEDLRIPVMRLPASQEVLFQFKDQVSEIGLSWQPVGGASQYDVQISNTPDFKKILLKYTTDKSTLHLSEKWPQGLFYWRVQAVNNYRESGWATPWSFRVVHGD